MTYYSYGMLQHDVGSVAPPAAPTGWGPAADRVRSDVAIIGGGASGTLTAIHLMASRAHDLCTTLHDASGELGQGLAYGTTDRRHLLNVRSRHMSAFPDIPGEDWQMSVPVRAGSNDGGSRRG